MQKTDIFLLSLSIAVLTGCQPTVKIEAPEKPIVINLNVNISQEVRVKVDRDLENAINTKTGLF